MHDMIALKGGRQRDPARPDAALGRPDFGLETTFRSLDALMKRERTLLDGVTSPPENWLAGAECATLGSPRRGLFRVLDGVCLGYRLFSDGRRHIFSIYLPGDLIGPDCLVAEVSRENLSPAVSARLALTPLKALRRIASVEPAIEQMLNREMVRRLAIHETWISLLGRCTAIERTAFLFCEIFERSRRAGTAFPDRCAFPLTQLDLADALGMSVVHINRVLKSLRDRELASLDSGWIHIRDWRRLASVASFESDYLV